MISRRNALAGTASMVAAVAMDAVPATAAPDTATAAPDTGRGGLRVTAPTVEYVRHPVGLDAQRPRLSWPLASDKPGTRQSAYQVRVATTASGLSRPDVWDSGKVTSGESVLVPYGGPELKPRTRYFWSVRVWDEDGRVSGWGAPSWWETGLMDAGQWTADWISAPASLTDAPSREGGSWIWFPEGDPANSVPAATRWFRGIARLPDGATAATLAISADNVYAVSVNGVEVARTDLETDNEGWRRPAVIDVLDRVRAGDNVIAVSATNATVGPAGLVAVLVVRTASGEQKVFTDGSWKTTDQQPPAAWREVGFGDGAWPTARVAAAWGGGPWGRVTPVSYAVTRLRHEFRLPRRKVARARLYSTALGLYEAHLNGKRVGRDQLAPGWTDYRTRVQYQTYDVTELLRPGANALGAYLAPGWYAGNVGMLGPGQYGKVPALRAQLEVEYADGSSERITSGTGWRAASGPIVAADLLNGETYDARRETPGWTSPGFDDEGWLGVRAVGDVGPGLIVAQVDGPVRVTEELTPKKVTEPRPADRHGTHRRRLPAAPAALLPQLGLPDRPGLHHDVGTLGLDPTRRQLPGPGHELLQPLCLRLGGRVDVHQHRRHLGGPARLPRDRHPPPSGRGGHLRPRHVHLALRPGLHTLAAEGRPLHPHLRGAAQHDRRGVDPRVHGGGGHPHSRDVPAPGGRLRGLPGRLRHAPLHRLTMCRARGPTRAWAWTADTRRLHPTPDARGLMPDTRHPTLKVWRPHPTPDARPVAPDDADSPDRPLSARTWRQGRAR